jgi:hypothetical protein
MKRVNIYKYPIGKLRVQPVGIIVFAAIMATLGVPSLLWLSNSPISNPLSTNVITFAICQDKCNAEMSVEMMNMNFFVRFPGLGPSC